MADIESVRLPDNSTFNIKDPTALHGTDGINALADVSASSPNDSDLMIYNGSTSKWTAQANPFTKPNLLKNGWFTVNERGFTSLVGFTTQETVNEWTFNSNASGVNATVTYSSGILTLSDNVYVEQRVENDRSTALTGKTLTMSAKLSDGTIYSGTVTNFDPTSDATFYNDTEPTLDYKASLNAFRIVVHAGETVAFRAIKLELGSISTLANDIEPDKTLETLACQKADFSQIAYQNLDATTARKNYSAGQYFFNADGEFCKAKVAISSGQTLTEGTNFEKTNVGDELKALSVGTEIAERYLNIGSSTTVELPAMYNYIVSVARAISSFSYVAIVSAEALLTELVQNSDIAVSFSGRNITIKNNLNNAVNVSIIRL